ncbi:MAG: ectonucleotide pyrophosphatase/phosphodiesterase [Bacteroidales bacterium]|nr:ectonucleotide pyrophosphatase/phosphodiesterase [Bacteroidales bacterium]
MKTFYFAVLSILFVFSSFAQNTNSKKDKPYLIVLSMDGFRWDYPDKVHTPNLDSIEKNGVRGKMQPSFPTKTFPNHYTMATGLYPDNHGIVANEFWDDSLKLFYRIPDRKSVKNPAFYKGEPIWVSAEKQKLTAATLFWVGSETPIKGIQATYWKDYQHNMPFEDRIDTVISWLQLPENKRPHLIMWYLHEPDGVGHKFGPESEQTFKKVVYLDSLIGVFLQKLKNTEIADKVNLIFTSDHGMCPISTNRIIYLEDILDTADVALITGANPVYNIKVKKGKLDKVYQSLQIEHIKCWKSGALPPRLHYGNNPRDLDLVIVADSSWSIERKHKKFVDYNGTHGYDNANNDMYAIFYAIGPAFKKGYKQKLFINTDLYLLFAKILKLNPGKTDGNINHIKSMLNN